MLTFGSIRLFWRRFRGSITSFLGSAITAIECSPGGGRPGQAVALACSRIHPGDLQVAVIADAIVDDHSHPHITHIKCAGIAETEVDLLISVRERLDGEITEERLNRLQWVKHQLLDASEAGVGVIVENMPPTGQVGAAAVQMQMIACPGHRHVPPSG